MATVIIRPDSISNSAGFNVSGNTLLGRINDNNTSTTATQNNTTCSISGIGFNNDSVYASATINSIVLSLVGQPGRSGAATVTCTITDTVNSDQLLAQGRSFGSGTTTGVYDTISSGLTPAIVNGLSVTISPNNQGITLKEVFITVTYTAGSSSNYANIAKVMGDDEANVAKVSGLAIANLSKISALD